MPSLVSETAKVLKRCCSASSTSVKRNRLCLDKHIDRRHRIFKSRPPSLQDVLTHLSGTALISSYPNGVDITKQQTHESSCRFSVEKPSTVQLAEARRRHASVSCAECELTLLQLQSSVKDLMSWLKFYPPEIRMQTTAAYVPLCLSDPACRVSLSSGGFLFAQF